MKWSIIIVCLIVHGCTFEPEQKMNIEAFKQKLKPRPKRITGAKSPVEMVKDEISSRAAENFQLNAEIQTLSTKIEENDRKIKTNKLATKRVIRECPQMMYK